MAGMVGRVALPCVRGLLGRGKQEVARDGWELESLKRERAKVVSARGGIAIALPLLERAREAAFRAREALLRRSSGGT